MDEKWEFITGFDNKYEISNKGRVRSHERKKGKCLKPFMKIGYWTIAFRKKHFSIHRLIAIYFIKNPLNKGEVNHINGIKTDNSLNNLEWCTRKENAQHASRIGLFDKISGANNKLAKLTKEDVINIRSKKGLIKNKILALIYGVSGPAISDIMLKKTWKYSL